MTAAQIQLLGYGIVGNVQRAIERLDNLNPPHPLALESQIGPALGEIHDARKALQMMETSIALLNPQTT